MSVTQRRNAFERWKQANRDYYLEQKRRLASRPEYKAHRREMYKQKVDELKLLGILPRKRGRPTLYNDEERLDIKRDRARDYAMRSRATHKRSQLLENDNTPTGTSEISDRLSDISGVTAKSTQERSWPSPANWNKVPNTS